jgi:hypothetical protein
MLISGSSGLPRPSRDCRAQPDGVSLPDRGLVTLKLRRKTRLGRVVGLGKRALPPGISEIIKGPPASAEIRREGVAHRLCRPHQ